MALGCTPAITKYAMVAQCLAPPSLYLLGFGWGGEFKRILGNKEFIRSY